MFYASIFDLLNLVAVPAVRILIKFATQSFKYYDYYQIALSSVLSGAGHFHNEDKDILSC